MKKAARRRRTTEEEIRLLMSEAGPGLSYKEARSMVCGQVGSMDDWRRANPVDEDRYPAGYMQGRGAA